MMLYIVYLLTDGYGQPEHEQITQLVDSREIFLVFDLNPDGGEYDISDNVYHSWRKNRQPNAGSLDIGTDLNRNHGYRWGGDGASAFPGSELFQGPAPASAPEVAAIESFVNNRTINGLQQITVAITFHTYGALVLWPYSYTYDDLPEDMRPDDHAVLVAMGQAMAATNSYTPEQFSDMYIASGEFTDWAYGIHHIFAYTFEMSGETDIAVSTARNRAAVLYLLEQAGCPYTVIGAAEAYCTNGRFNAPKRVWLPILDSCGSDCRSWIAKERHTEAARMTPGRSGRVSPFSSNASWSL
jgi:hypothetical protein